MTTRWLTLLVTILAFTNEARADAGLPFFPRDAADLHVRFENLSDFPEFEFYLKCPKNVHIGNNSQYLHSIMASSTTRFFSWGRLGPVVLVAVPRGQKVPTPDELREVPDWIIEQIPGTLESKRLPGSAGFLSKADNGGEIIYRVAIDGETLTVELVEARLPTKIWPWIVLGFLAVVVLTIGVAIYLGLRLRRVAIGSPQGKD